MTVIRCDRCGVDVQSDSGLRGDLMIRAPVVEQARGHVAEGKLGRYQFEVLNAQFKSQDGQLAKVDLCRGCVKEIAEMKAVVGA